MMVHERMGRLRIYRLQNIGQAISNIVKLLRLNTAFLMSDFIVIVTIV